jgi:mono/diheme cytochrome c family protein
VFLVTVLLVSVSAAACGDWFTTFTRQPAIHPWQVATMDSTAMDSTPARGNPQGSVPLYGSALPDWVVSYAPFANRLDSMSVLVNPREATDASINNGHKYYQLTCVVCHGQTGQGDGLALQSVRLIISLVSDSARSRSEGYLFGIIRNGRGAMPTYNRIEESDRWDIVNYVLGLQGRLGRAVPTGPLGTPGETGASLPGATMTAPQRPPPHFPTSRIGSGG